MPKDRSRNIHANTTKWLKASCCLIAAGTILCASAASVRAKPPVVAGPVTFIGQVILPAGSANGSVEILTVPKGFHLVVQTVSYFRSNVVAGSVGNLFVETTYNKVLGYVAAPEAVADGSTYPSGTLNATFYCGAGTPVIVNAYRSGSDTAQETDNIIVTGYYVADSTS